MWLRLNRWYHYWGQVRAKPKVISEALGHSSVAFTMDGYSHIIEGMKEAAKLLPEGLVKNSVASLAPISDIMSSRP